MHSWMHDLRVGARQALRRPGSSLLLVAILMLGIGAATAMFSVLRPVLLQALPYPDGDRLVYLHETDFANNEQFGGVSFPDLADWRASAKKFAAFGAFARSDATIRLADGPPRRVTTLNASAELLPTLGIAPLHGRGFEARDDVVGAAPVVILSHALWRDAFGADPGAVGGTLEVDGKTAQIVGVMPEAAAWSITGDVWRPVAPTQPNFIAERGVHSLRVVARLRDGVSLAAANDEIGAIASALEKQYPQDNKGRGARASAMHAFLVRDVERPLWLLGAAIVVLLLLTCNNAAALLLARTSAREAELAVRSSLGARRARLAGQLFAECLVLVAAGTGAGVLLAQVLLELAVRINPIEALDPAVWRIDARALLFAVATCGAAALLAGTFPAWLGARVSPASALGAARGSVAAGGDRLRRMLVASQVAIALLLLLAVGVLVRSYAGMARVELGVHGDGVASVTVGLPAGKYPMPPLDTYPMWPEVTQFMAALDERVAALPGVVSHAFVQNAPLDSAWTTSVTVEGREVPADAHEEWQMQAYGPGALRTLGIPLLAGRDLDAQDVHGRPAVVLINEAAARQYFPGQDPIGRRIRFWGTPREVVGVVGDVRTDGATEPAAPAVHPPLAQTPFSTFSIVARTEADAATLFPALREAIWSVDGDVVPYDEATLDERIARLTAPQRFALGIAGLLAAIAAVLALSGVVGTIAIEVHRRRNEIGVRVALGARARQVVRLVLARSIRMVAIGAIVGVATYLAAATALERFVFGVSARDPIAIAAVLALFGLGAVLACVAPARRALAVEPMQVLRSE